MRSIMRGIILLPLVFQSSAGDVPIGCELSSGSAVAHALNAAMDIWAASERCKKDSKYAKYPAFCEIDVAGAISQTIKTIDAIIFMVEKCGQIDVQFGRCGHTVNQLVASSAGLAEAGGKIAARCQTMTGLNEYKWMKNPAERKTVLGKCVGFSGKTANLAFKAGHVIRQYGKKSAQGNALDIITVISALGAYISSAVATCNLVDGDGKYDPKTEESKQMSKEAGCAAGVLEGTAYLSGVARLGMAVEKACAPEPSGPGVWVPYSERGPTNGTRLYEETEAAHQASAFSPAVLGFTALLPIAGVLSFVAGTKYRKTHETRTFARIAESEHADESRVPAEA